MKKRIIALACLAAICLGVAQSPIAHAAVSTAASKPPAVRWLNTDAITLSISFSSGTAYCSGIIEAYSNTKKIEATFQLLKKNASGGFSAEYTWPKVTVNGDYLTWSGSRPVSKGVYRLQVTAVVTNKNNVSETIVTYCEKEYK